MHRDMPAHFVDGRDLGYARALTIPADGARYLFDESYRRAHLPLVAPDHSLVIAQDQARGYRMGVHGIIYSAVLPVSADALDESPMFRRLEADLRNASFAKKIAWDIVAQRKPVLHATVCGTLSSDAPPILGSAVREQLRGTGSFSAELRGLFSGNLNIGRLYLPLYPEMRQGRNMVHAVQQALGRPPGDMYLAGIYNFTDELTVEETSVLQRLLRQWQDKPLLRFSCDEIWILGGRDDLVLDHDIYEKIALK